MWPTPCRRRRAICSFSRHLVQHRPFVVLRMLMLSLAHGALFSSQKRGNQPGVVVVVCVPRVVHTWSYAAFEPDRSSLVQQGKPRRRRVGNLRRTAGPYRAFSTSYPRASLQIPRSYGELLHARSEHRKASAVTARLRTTCGARAYPQRSRRQRQSARRPSAGSCDRRRLRLKLARRDL